MKRWMSLSQQWVYLSQGRCYVFRPNYDTGTMFYMLKKIQNMRLEAWVFHEQREGRGRNMSWDGDLTLGGWRKVAVSWIPKKEALSRRGVFWGATCCQVIKEAGSPFHLEQTPLQIRGLWSSWWALLVHQWHWQGCPLVSFMGTLSVLPKLVMSINTAHCSGDNKGCFSGNSEVTDWEMNEWQACCIAQTVWTAFLFFLHHVLSLGLLLDSGSCSRSICSCIVVFLLSFTSDSHYAKYTLPSLRATAWGGFYREGS